MAIFQNDPFPGTDYNQYQSWQQVRTPDGLIFYVVPGHPGYVYDPVASRASGRRVFRQNPERALEAQREEEDRVRKQNEQAEFNNSPAGQLLPVAGTVAGTVAAAHLMPTTAAEKLAAAKLAALGGGGGAGTAGTVATPEILGASQAGSTGASAAEIAAG